MGCICDKLEKKDQSYKPNNTNPYEIPINKTKINNSHHYNNNVSKDNNNNMYSIQKPNKPYNINGPGNIQNILNNPKKDNVPQKTIKELKNTKPIKEINNNYLPEKKILIKPELKLINENKKENNKIPNKYNTFLMEPKKNVFNNLLNNNSLELTKNINQEIKSKEKIEKKNITIEKNHEMKISKQMIVDKNKIRPHVDLETANKISKSVCKILIKRKEGTQAGTGFFMIYKNDKYLITCYHVVNSEIKKFEIEIYNKNIFNFDLKNRYIEYFKEQSDITVIELTNSDEFINYIDCLDYDLNIIRGYSQYKNVNIFNISYPKGLNSVAESGSISEKIIDTEFYHDINTEKGSSGSPIILLNTQKVIGIHKQADKEKKLNAGTFIDVIFKKIDENKNDKKENINKIIDEIGVNIIQIDILDKYMCSINYKLSDKNYKDLGFLVQFPIFKKTNYLKGFITKYYIEEYKLFKTKGINIYNNNNLLDNFTSEDRFIFSDEFLNVTFIEIKNLNLNFIDIYEEYISKDITLINYSKEANTVNTTYGKFIEKWGIYIIYKEFEDLLYLNYQSSHCNSGLLYNDKLVGIHKQNSFENEVATNIEIISKAIKLNYKSYLNDKANYLEQKGRENKLNENQINELKNNGLELTDISNVLISPPSFFVTPIWFLRTKHAWYWSPFKPEKNDINKSNWMIIYPNNSVKVVGGIYNGIEPAPKNVDIIHWLENTRFKYL